MKIRTLLIILLTAPQVLPAEVSLPAFFSDNMILQREREVKVWGWADPGESIILQFNGQRHGTQASEQGTWSIILPPMRASSQPRDMIIEGENHVLIRNILIGDVWICGGQSNMEWVVANSDHAAEEIKNADYPDIRLLTVPEYISFQPVKDFKPAEWKSAVGENISDFSAVGYFFGRHIHESQGGPVGLISSTRGGSRAETWTSAEGLAGFGHTEEALERMKTAGMSYIEYTAGWKEEVQEWLDENYPSTDEGLEKEWYAENYDYRDWKEIEVPSKIQEQEGLDYFHGIVWYKKSFTLPENLRNRELYFRPGYIKDMDETWINGTKIGETFGLTSWRSYKLPADILNQEGENVITMRVFSPRNEGGITEPDPRKVNISRERWSVMPDDLGLAGTWKYRTTLRLEDPVATPLPRKQGPDDFPSSLYNGMIHPLIPFAIKGVVWYQGEANTKSYEDAVRYREVFANMIGDWRTGWGYDFPFYFVQLPNYIARLSECEDLCGGIWPWLRESQQRALRLPSTGMVVTIDAGSPHDIHPRDKQTVGHRLGLVADAKAYGDERVVYSGPCYKSYQVDGNRILIEFEPNGTGLAVRGGGAGPGGFSIAGGDKIFHPARASIENNRVVAYSANVDKPLAVRYAWEDNPEDANLCNREGLPAAPFRTDEW